MNKKKNLIEWNELFFVIYYFSFILVKPISAVYDKTSTIILFLITIVIVILYLIYNHFTLVYSNFKIFCIFAAIFSILFFLSWVMNDNNYIIKYFKEFMISGIVSWILLINIERYDKLLLYWSSIGSWTGIIAVIDSIIGNFMFNDYMVLGYEGLLPAFACCLIQRFYYSKKKYSILMIIYLVDMVIYANKGATLTAFVLIAIIYICFSKNKRNSKLRLIISLIGTALIYLFRYDLIRNLLKIARIMNVSSYSLVTLNMLLNDNANLVINLRTDIWNAAIEYILYKPLFGYGIGFFTVDYGIYPHNIFLDIALSFGVVSSFILIFILFRSIIEVIMLRDKEQKVLLIVLFVISIIPLSLSLTLWQYMPFWSFLGLYFMRKRQTYI